MNIRETDDLWRIYRNEWTLIHVADTRAEAVAYFDQHFHDRVVGDDVRYVTDGSGRSALAQLWLRLPVLKGEAKTRELAERLATERAWANVTIVQRNSRGDHELRAYGVRKLPAS